MGCDIHPYYEVRKPGGVWEYVSVREKHAGGPKDEDGHQPVNYDTYFKDPLYIGRNYDLFAILADVRNGRGFAWCVTGEGFEPLAQPRGVPDDISRRVFNEYTLVVIPDEEGKEWPGVEGVVFESRAGKWVQEGSSVYLPGGTGVISHPDYHSASYFTLAELLAAEATWSKTTGHRGWVDAWNFEVWRKEGKPHSWCGGVGGGGVEHVSNTTLAVLIDSGALVFDPEPPPGFYEGHGYRLNGKPGGRVGTPSLWTEVVWREEYRVSARRFVEQTIPAMKELIPEGGTAADVRLVFWFDN